MLVKVMYRENVKGNKTIEIYDIDKITIHTSSVMLKEIVLWERDFNGTFNCIDSFYLGATEKIYLMSDQGKTLEAIYASAEDLKSYDSYTKSLPTDCLLWINKKRVKL